MSSAGGISRLAPPAGLEVQGPTLMSSGSKRSPGQEWTAFIWVLEALWTVSPATSAK